MSQALPIQVVIAEDHPRIRSWIRVLLKRESDIQIAGEAQNGLEAVELCEQLHPDLLLLDIEMPVMDGITVIHQLIQKHCPVKVLILSSYDDQGYIEQLKDLGANGYLVKEDAPRHLAGFIRRIDKGAQAFTEPVEAIILPLPSREQPRAG